MADPLWAKLYRQAVRHPPFGLPAVPLQVTEGDYCHAERLPASLPAQPPPARREPLELPVLRAVLKKEPPPFLL